MKDSDWTSLIRKVEVLRRSIKATQHKCDSAKGRRDAVQKRRKSVKKTATHLIETIKYYKTQKTEKKKAMSILQKRIDEKLQSARLSRIFKAIEDDISYLDFPDLDVYVGDEKYKLELLQSNIDDLSLKMAKDYEQIKEVTDELAKLTSDLKKFENEISFYKTELRKMSSKMDMEYLRPRQIVFVKDLSDSKVLMKVCTTHRILKGQKLEISISNYVKTKSTKKWYKVRQLRSDRMESDSKSNKLEELYLDYLKDRE